MLGCSAGGFAALLYGILLNVDKIITFNPQTFLDSSTRLLYKDSRWNDYSKLNNLQDNSYLNLKNLTPIDGLKSKIYIIYSKKNRLDVAHFNNIKQNNNYNITGVDIDTNEHLLANYLKKDDRLNQYLFMV